MPKFKPYNQNQIMLLPPCITDWVPKDHSCFVINEIVDTLNIDCIEKTYSDNGASAYNPRMLIKLVFYSYSQGIRSSRKIEDLACESIVYRYLCANQCPDHGTISLFRKEHLNDLEKLFAQIVILCNGLGLVDLTDISIDGSIFKANASKKSTYNQESIAKLQKKIGEILKEAEEIDQEEDKKYGKEKGYNTIPEKIKNPDIRKKEIERLQKKLSKLEVADKVITENQEKVKTNEEKSLSKNKSYNTTDPDAKLMRMKNKSYQPAFNGQISTSNQLILGYQISDEATDTNLLHPMIEKTQDITGQKVKTVKADAGYFSKKNIEEIEEKQINAYIPDQQKSLEERRERKGEVPAFDRRKFEYDKEQDKFICPQGKRLSLTSTEQGTKKYTASECQNCKVKAQCTKGKNRQINYNPQLEEYKTQMRKKLNEPEGKNKYQERMSDVEPVFGNITFNQNARNFLCRGKPMVKIEFGLSCLAHNLTKMSNYIKEKRKNGENIQLEILAKI